MDPFGETDPAYETDPPSARSVSPRLSRPIGPGTIYEAIYLSSI